MEKIDKKVVSRFNYIKKLINNKNDRKILVDGLFWYNEKAVSYINKIDKNYFMNHFYNLTNLDFLLMIDGASNIYKVQKKLFLEYDHSYASSVWNAFIECLGRDTK